MFFFIFINLLNIIFLFLRIPLAAGLFNREVYLEGMRRRLNNSDMSSSAVCSIQ